MNWEFRILRRFMVVFLSGGLLALIAELNLFSTGASSEQTLYLSALVALLVALEKMIRDHKNEPVAGLNTKVSV